MFQYFSYKQQFSADQWWSIKLKQFERAKDFDGAEFARFMVGLHSCVASSAGIERWFSTIGFVWSKVRNRLGFKKAEKLATVYRGLRGTSSKAMKTPIQIVPGTVPTAASSSDITGQDGDRVAVVDDDNDDIERHPVLIFNDDDTDSDLEDDDLASVLPADEDFEF